MYPRSKTFFIEALLPSSQGLFSASSAHLENFTQSGNKIKIASKLGTQKKFHYYFWGNKKYNLILFICTKQGAVMLIVAFLLLAVASASSSKETNWLFPLQIITIKNVQFGNNTNLHQWLKPTTAASMKHCCYIPSTHGRIIHSTTVGGGPCMCRLVRAMCCEASSRRKRKVR